RVDGSKPVGLERRDGPDGGIRGLRALATRSAVLTMKSGITVAAAATGLVTTWAAVMLPHVTAAEMKAPGASLKFAHVIDLTHALDENTPYIPVPNITFPLGKTPIATFAAHGVAAYRWEIHEHLGTHIDAPSHFFEGGLPVDRLPVDSLVVPLVV